MFDIATIMPFLKSLASSGLDGAMGGAATAVPEIGNVVEPAQANSPTGATNRVGKKAAQVNNASNAVEGLDANETLSNLNPMKAISDLTGFTDAEKRRLSSAQNLFGSLWG